MNKKIIYKKLLFQTLFALSIVWIIVDLFFLTASPLSVALIISLTFFTVSNVESNIILNKLAHKYSNPRHFITNFTKYSPDILSYKNDRLKYITGNQTLCDIVKIKNPEDLENKSDYNLFTKKQADTIRKYDNRTLQSGHVSKYLMELQNSDGKTVIYQFIITPIVQNNSITGLLTTARDVTNCENIKKDYALKQSQIKAILDNLSIITFLKDKEGNFIRGNSKCIELFNTSENFYEKTLSELYAGVYSSEIFLEDQEVINKKETKTYTKKMKLFSTPEQWYRVSKSPICNDKGDVTGIVVSAENVEKEIEASCQKETYVATLSHDLKTPTIAQIRSLELLSKGMFGELNSKQQEIIELTLDSCKYMLEMVSTILSTYKYESGEIQLNLEEFNIIEMTMEICKELENIAKDKKMNIAIMPEQGDNNICADKMQMKRVITNLLTNSIAYAHENSEIVISIKNMKKDTMEYLVKNKSSYIPPSMLKNIFDKYVTHKSKYNKIGIGLGLYLSRQIIEAHKGSMIAESTPKDENIFGFVINKHLNDIKTVEAKLDNIS